MSDGTSETKRAVETRDIVRHPAEELEDLEPSEQVAEEVHGGMGINRVVVTDGTIKS